MSLTKWEIGQELIAINDFMGEKAVEFKMNGLDNLSNKINELRAKVGDLFNENNDHDFGIFDSALLKKTQGLSK